jgi:hypothetical protein
MLERRGGRDEHDPAVMARAQAWFDRSSESERARLLANLMAIDGAEGDGDTRARAPDSHARTRRESHRGFNRQI